MVMGDLPERVLGTEHRGGWAGCIGAKRDHAEKAGRSHPSAGIPRMNAGRETNDSNFRRDAEGPQNLSGPSARLNLALTIPCCRVSLNLSLHGQAAPASVRRRLHVGLAD